MHKLFEAELCESIIVPDDELMTMLTDASFLYNSWCFRADILHDTLSMNSMDEDETYIWSLRESGTWFMHEEFYLAMVEENDTRHTFRYLVAHRNGLYKFTRIS